MNNKLWEATEKGDLDAMKTAVADGAQMEHRGDIDCGDSKTCLHVSAENGHLDATKLLLNEGAKVDAVTEGTRRTAMMMASRNNIPDMVELLLEHNGRTDLKDWQGWTALHHATFNADLSALKLLAEKSNVNARENQGMTPLCMAVENCWSRKEDKDALIQLLKQNGATM